MLRPLLYIAFFALPLFSCDDPSPEEDVTASTQGVQTARPADVSPAPTGNNPATTTPRLLLPGKYKVMPGTTKYDERCDLFTDNTGSWYARDKNTDQLREEIRFSWNFSDPTLKFTGRQQHIFKPNEFKPTWTALPDEQYRVSVITDTSFTMTPAGSTNEITYVRIGAPAKTGPAR